MGGVMRPVGPESSETYWLRRALVVGAMLVLLIIVLLFLVNLGGSPGQAAPGGTAARSASPSIAAATADAPSSEPTRSAASGSATPSVSPSVSPSPKSSASAAAPPSRRASSAATAQQSAGHRTIAPSAATPASCDPEDLRATLRGDRHRVKVGSKVTFRLSLINGSEKSCVITTDAKDFELKIYSGTDRIWSSDDCARAVPAVHRPTTPEHAVAWTMSWNGKRSRRDAECVAGPGLPRPGYYYATAQLEGAKPVQFLMVLS